MSHTVIIGDQHVPLKGASSDTLDKVLQFQPFKDWVQQFDKEQQKWKNEMKISSIEVQSTDVFSSEKLGFVKLKADVKFKDTDSSAPGIVFMRGGSVSILIILRPNDAEGEDRVILTLQPRVPVPSLSFPELPAGMLDGSGNFSGAAAKEIEEETGLQIKDDELCDLTELAYGDSQWRGVYPSAGGSDEFLRLFTCVKHMKKSEINQLEGKLTGLRDHGEKITLKVVPLKNAWKEAPDAKLLSSLALYKCLKEAGKIDT
ncbi:uncharacterized protein BYT42DRAFT_617640 [Radiomyces spectabilis]|uniref:uncharacterized protein n=1 Tax=Radiomyces spectabilis TaxID=64574 RepID=UPI0022204EF1|nr:uncharacterized protein BYT42DRAFT_617640 [Radiomyces spectabilis]KAI8369640.1 hypothetical protein BYT42DRAFT_617640 [Radiomyces spectabilis]